VDHLRQRFFPPSPTLLLPPHCQAYQTRVFAKQSHPCIHGFRQSPPWVQKLGRFFARSLRSVQLRCDVPDSTPPAILPTIPVLTLAEWIGEGALRQSPVRVQDPQTGRTLCTVPDAAFTLSLPDSTAATFLLELDRGTVPLDRIKMQKLRVYLLRQHNPCPVLFVVPDSKRQSAIARVALEEAQRLGANPTTIWITKLVSMTPPRPGLSWDTNDR
jgi:hypothetical protein